MCSESQRDGSSHASASACDQRRSTGEVNFSISHEQGKAESSRLERL